MSKLQQIKRLPLLAAAAATETALASQYVKLTNAQWATFLVSFGANATTADTDIVTVTVECSTAGSSNATEVAIPFQYRLSAKVGTDSMGAFTAATSSGAAIAMGSETAASGSAAMLEIHVDPASLPAQLTDGVYLRVVATPSGSSSISVNVGVVAELQTRYSGAVSAT